MTTFSDITGSNENFDTFIKVPVVNSPVTAQSVSTGSQGLANRTQWLKSELTRISGSVATNINSLEADINSANSARTILSGVVAIDINSLEADIANLEIQAGGDLSGLSSSIASDINDLQSDVSSNDSDISSINSTITSFSGSTASEINSLQSDVLLITSSLTNIESLLTTTIADFGSRISTLEDFPWIAAACRFRSTNGSVSFIGNRKNVNSITVGSSTFDVAFSSNVSTPYQVLGVCYTPNTVTRLDPILVGDPVTQATNAARFYVVDASGGIAYALGVNTIEVSVLVINNSLL